MDTESLPPIHTFGGLWQWENLDWLRPIVQLAQHKPREPVTLMDIGCNTDLVNVAHRHLPIVPFGIMPADMCASVRRTFRGDRIVLHDWYFGQPRMVFPKPPDITISLGSLPHLPKNEQEAALDILAAGRFVVLTLMHPAQWEWDCSPITWARRLASRGLHFDRLASIQLRLATHIRALQYSSLVLRKELPPDADGSFSLPDELEGDQQAYSGT